METAFLISGIIAFGCGCLLAAFASVAPYSLIDEINERSPADRQIDGFPRISEAMWRRHGELLPGSPKRRLMGLAGVLAVAMMLAGLGLLLDYSSLHELSRNRVVAPRQQATTGTVTAGTVGRASYSYTFTVDDVSYSDWGSIPGSETKAGQQVTVYYDPENPAVNALVRFEYSVGLRSWDVGVGILANLFIATGIVISIFIARSWRRPSPSRYLDGPPG